MNRAQAVPVRPPPGNVAVKVSLINPVTFGPSILKRFMAPDVPGLETFASAPSLTFLLEHPSGRKLQWDLGIRDDYATGYSKQITDYIPTTNYDIRIHGSVADIIEREGIKREQVEAVIWSHWHWDHIGDAATFPPSTELIVGKGFKKGMMPGYPENPDSPIQEADWKGRTLREIDFEGPNTLQIGQFPAFDYFGDGSFYLLDSPGHAIGHLCGLVRTTSSPDTFVLLGGDVCHYSGILRPSKHMHIPESISPNPVDPSSQSPLCPGHAFDDLQNARGRGKDDTLYRMTYGLDTELGTQTVGKLQELDCSDDIFVIIAHDAHVDRIVDHFPASLNAWREKGWGAQARWAWLRDLEPWWKSQGVV